MTVGGCGADDGGASDASGRLFSPTARHALQVGLDERVPAEGTLGNILAARLTDDGKHLVVLDFVDPYIKVFDGEGHFERAFMREGGGPGEARRPTAMGVAGDSAVLVWDGTRRLSVLGLDGRLRYEVPYPGFPVLAAVAGCAGEWVVYGPRFEPNSAQAHWLHRLRVAPDGSVSVQDALRDSLAAPTVPHGVAYGLIARGDSVYLWHTLGARKLLAAWRCGDADARVLYRESADAAPAGPMRRVEGGLKMEIGPGSRARGGMAAVGDGVVVGEIVHGEDGETTELTLISRGGMRRSVRVPGSYVIRDARDGSGVLMSASEPVPRVFLVSGRELLALFPPAEREMTAVRPIPSRAARPTRAGPRGRRG